MNDFSTLLQAIIGLVFVLCLIGLCAVAARRYAPLLTRALQNKNRRLQLLEVLPLDPRHRAILLRCDEQDHLIIVGEGGTTLITQPTQNKQPSDGATAL
jgi:flagellar protein FliO/FliZ